MPPHISPVTRDVLLGLALGTSLLLALGGAYFAGVMASAGSRACPAPATAQSTGSAS